MTHDATDSSPKPPFPARRLLAGVLAVVAAAQVVATLGTLSAPLVYRKDLLQDYLAARAILDGRDPYQPMGVLRSAYLPGVEDALAFPHPTPHPPPALLLTLPLGVTTYPRAAAAWLAFEYLLLAACALVIARRAWGTRVYGPPLLLGMLALAASPVRDDLVLGQFTVLILALLTGSYAALTGRRPVAAGLLLGAAVSLKFLGWPLLLFCAWRRRWDVVLPAAVAVLVAYAACALLMPGAVPEYFTAVAPQANAGYSASDGNLSVWTVGQRLFGGLYSQATVNLVTAPPLIAWPGLASKTGAAVALATFLIALRSASRLRDDGDGFLVMLSVSTVLNPIAWGIYFTLLLLPLAVIGQRLAERKWPPRFSAAFAALVLLLAALRVPHSLVFGHGTHSNVPAVVALVTAVPLLWPLATACLVARSAGLNPGRERCDSQIAPAHCPEGA